MRAARHMFAAAMVAIGGGIVSGQETRPTTTTAPARAPSPPNAAARANTPAPALAQQYWFGVAVQNLPRAIATQLKLKPEQGLMVLAVLPDSPAKKADLKPGDILIEIDGNVLTSYEELARAANQRQEKPEGAQKGVAAQDMELKLASALLPGPCQLTILRAGDRKSLKIVPAARPGNLQVSGGELSNFTLTSAPNRGQSRPEPSNAMKTLVLNNGATVQVGPGYAIDLSGREASTVSLRRMVERGETITFSQEIEGGGAVRHRLTVGNKSYSVEPGKFETLPAELQPVARQLFLSMPPAPGQPPATARASVPVKAGPAPTPVAMEKRIDDLEAQNARLSEQNEQTQRKLDETQRKLDRVLQLLQQWAE